MAFYKLCDCGEKNIFEHRGMPPRKCAKCGRSLLEVTTVDEAQQNTEIIEPPLDTDNNGEKEEERAHKGGKLYYSLYSPKADCQIIIPPEGGVVGRNALGAQLFAKNSAVSREHIKVSYRGRLGLTIVDISKYGTYVNDELLVQGTPALVHNGDVIKLYDFELCVQRHEE